MVQNYIISCMPNIFPPPKLCFHPSLFGRKRYLEAGKTIVDILSLILVKKIWFSQESKFGLNLLIYLSYILLTA